MGFVSNIRMAERRLVEFFFQKPFIRRAHRVFGSAEHCTPAPRGVTECILRHGTAMAPGDTFRPIGDFLPSLPFPPLLGSVHLPHRHRPPTPWPRPPPPPPFERR